MMNKTEIDTVAFLVAIGIAVGAVGGILGPLQAIVLVLTALVVVTMDSAPGDSDGC